MISVCGGYEGSNRYVQEKGCKAWHNQLKAGSLKFLSLK
jgi:hypothetical protein